MSDGFTSEIIQSALEFAAEEMFGILRKTSMSPIIYEVLDVGTGITDAKGELISSGAGIPSFVGVLDKSVQAILAQIGPDISEGDVFAVNDPNYGGVTHLNDVVVAEPVFHEERLIAWCASIAHWGDIGGRTPGSMAADARQIVEEGLRLPVVRLFSKGIRNDAVFDIVRANSRLPDFVTGDLWAQVSAGRRGASVVRGLARRYGSNSFLEAIDVERRRGLERARAGLCLLPTGRFRIEEPQDDGPPWRASITISEENFRVDLREAPSETAGPHNTSRDGAVIACQMLFKALTDPERYANAGSFEPLEVLTMPGTVFHAGSEAPHGYYFETRIRLFDMLWHCLAQAMPDRLPAGHFASIFGTVVAGAHPDTGRHFAMVEPQMGGWGATSGRRGQTAMFSTSHGDTFNCPVEIAEARYGIEVVEKRLSGRNVRVGENCGGDGVLTRYRLRGTATVSSGLSHGRVPVWGLPGGANGGLNSLRILRNGHPPESHRFISGIGLAAGDELEIQTAYGGSSPSRASP